MSGKGIAAFVDGFIGGRDKRRQWKREDEDQVWTGKVRGREETEWGQSDEDRGRRHKREDVAEGRDTTRWGWEQDKYGDYRKDRGRRIDWEDYEQSRVKQRDGREDDERQRYADAFGAAQGSYQAEQDTLAAQEAAQAAAQAAARAAAAERAGSMAPTAPVDDSWKAMKNGATGGTVTRGADGRMSYQDPIHTITDQDQIKAKIAEGGFYPMHEQGPAMPQPTTGPEPTRAGRVLPRDDWRMMKNGATGGTVTRGADGRMSYSDPVFQTDDQGRIAKMLDQGDYRQVEEQGPAMPPQMQQAAQAQQQGRGMVAADPAQFDKQATRAARSFMDHYRETAAPQIMEGFLKAGEPAKAEAFRTFMESGQTQEAMTHWSKSIFAAQTGNARAFAENLAKAYNTRGYFDDGIDALIDKSAIEEDPETGEIYGHITFANTETGEEVQMPFRGLDDLYRSGVGMLAPQEVFKRNLEQTDKADERRAQLLDTYSKEAGNNADKTEFENVTKVMETLAKSTEGMSMTPDEQMAAAIAYVRQFDDKGRYIGKAEGAAAPATQAAPAAPQDDLPIFMR